MSTTKPALTRHLGLQTLRGAWQRLNMMLLLATFTFASSLAQSTFGGGSGTQNNPYLIYNTDQLDQLAANVKSGSTYENVYFKLMADLDYANKTYTPIGGALYDDGKGGIGERQFCGKFFGNNHSINNVTINSESDDYCGLFGFLGYEGIVRDLTLGGNSSIVSTGVVGGIAGEVYRNAEIENCQVGENVVISVHSVASGSSYDPIYFGGIAGISSGTIENCVSKATVNNGDIAKAKNLGGIVGYLGSSGWIGGNRFLGVVEGSQHVGDIVGQNNGGTISDLEGYVPPYGDFNYINYYHTSVRHGGVNGSDVSGTKWMGTVTFGEHVSGSLTSDATFEDGSTPYYSVGKAMVMSNMKYEQAGYIVEDVTYSANGVALVEDGTDYTFTMPDDDVIITGSATVKRDIAYSNWVTITIPNQLYSGHALTPVVTVTDNKTGTPVTLEEGTDYTVTLPDGGCTDWGNYKITITGIGTFGGQATAMFSIVYPGSGTETDPYIILSTDELDALAASVNGGDWKTGQHFRLMANLDYSGKTYTPIGRTAQFQGTFDGYGHSISNVVINQPNQEGQALFAIIGDNGTVKNLVLGTGSSITGKKFVGGIAGLCKGTVMGCTVSEGVTIKGYQEVGGITGRINGTLSWCVNKSSVSGTLQYVGGIAGYSIESTINDNLNLGIVGSRLEYALYEGGIVGSNSNTLLSNNYYAGRCTKGGINGSDVAGAMRGWTVTADNGIVFQRFPDNNGKMTGYTDDGITYLGAGETSKMNISRGYEFSGYTLTVSAGTLTAVEGEDDMYTLAMPSPGQNVNISLTGTLTLDLLDNDNNASRISDNVGFTGSVRLNGRTLYKDGKWNTLCLPFDVTIADSPLNGTGVVARTLTEASITGTTLNLTFGNPVTTLTAGVPYIIKWTKADGYDSASEETRDIKNPVFSNVTVVSTLHPVENTDIDFEGSYTPVSITDIEGDNTLLYLGANNTLYWPNAPMTIGAQRAVFRLKGGITAGSPSDPNATVRAFNLKFGEDDATGIISTTNCTNYTNSADAWYSLDGRKLSGKPTKKGLYINNGRKVVVK